MIIQPLNIAPKIIETLFRLKYGSKSGDRTKTMVDRLIPIIEEAQKFILPDDGFIFEDNGWSEKECSMFKLPFKSIVAEYNFDAEGKKIGMGIVSWEFSNIEDDTRKKIAIAPFVYNGTLKCYCPNLYITIVDERPIPFMKDGDMKLRTHKHYFDEEALRKWSSATEFEHGCSDEISRYATTIIRQLCAALSCKNVTTQTITPKRKITNGKKGKKELFEYHVLIIDPWGNKTKTDPRGGTHASPRCHLRRGHIRHLKNMNVWVNQCVVGNRWWIEKDYEVKPLQKNI